MANRARGRPSVVRDLERGRGTESPYDVGTIRSVLDMAGVAMPRGDDGETAIGIRGTPKTHR